MNQKQCVSLRRIFLLVKSDMMLYRSTIITTATVILAILLLSNLFVPDIIFEVGQHPTGFVLLLFGGGYWISSNAFRNWHESPKAYFFLMMPGSTLEKLLARWFLTSIGYAVFVLLFYSIFYWIIATIAFILTKESYFVAIPFSAQIWRLILQYIILQSIFLLGSIYFKKSALIKTILVVSCLGIFLIILTVLINKPWSHTWLYIWLYNNVFDFGNIIKINQAVALIFYFIISLLIAPISWIASYLRLKEIEA